MGTVVTFPEMRCSTRVTNNASLGSATIIILPVVRIERHDDEPADGYSATSSSARKRRRPGSRP
jgi:hypothetical protein